MRCSPADPRQWSVSAVLYRLVGRSVEGTRQSSWRTSWRAAPGVLEAAVIAIPDERWTERPLVCVVAKPGASLDPAELARFLDGQVAAWQVPENWTFLDEVPKTTVGKFDKKVLWARYRSGELDVQRTKP